MKNENGISVESIYTGPLDFIDVNYTNLNQTIRYEQRPHGEWIKERLQIDERHFRSFAKCKVCGCEFKPYSFAVKEFDFCPKCGADMRKERECEE